MILVFAKKLAENNPQEIRETLAAAGGAATREFSIELAVRLEKVA